MFTRCEGRRGNGFARSILRLRFGGVDLNVDVDHQGFMKLCSIVIVSVLSIV